MLVDPRYHRVCLSYWGIKCSHIVDHALGANQMSVNELRFELDEMGLNVGGSKVPSRLSLVLGYSMKDWVMNENLCTNRAH